MSDKRYFIVALKSKDVHYGYLTDSEINNLSINSLYLNTSMMFSLNYMNKQDRSTCGVSASRILGFLPKKFDKNGIDLLIYFETIFKPHAILDIESGNCLLLNYFDFSKLKASDGKFIESVKLTFNSNDFHVYKFLYKKSLISKLNELLSKDELNECQDNATKIDLLARKLDYLEGLQAFRKLKSFKEGFLKDRVFVKEIIERLIKGKSNSRLIKEFEEFL